MPPAVPLGVDLVHSGPESSVLRLTFTEGRKHEVKRYCDALGHRVQRHPAHQVDVTDLGLEWRDWTGLPFVFARWAVASRIPIRERRAFEQALDAALDRGMAALPEIAATRRDLGWTAAQIESYLRNFAFRLGPDEEKGAAEFVRLRTQLGPLPC